MAHLDARMAGALLALAGLLDAAYLALARLRGGAVACPVGGGCDAVQASPYAALGGVPVAYLGVAGYALLLGLWLRSLHADDVAGLPIGRLLLAASAAGALFSAYLTYVQIALIGAICFWCALSALIQLLLLALALRVWAARAGGLGGRAPH